MTYVYEYTCMCTGACAVQRASHQVLLHRGSTSPSLVYHDVRSACSLALGSALTSHLSQISRQPSVTVSTLSLTVSVKYNDVHLSHIVEGGERHLHGRARKSESRHH